MGIKQTRKMVKNNLFVYVGLSCLIFLSCSNKDSKDSIVTPAPIPIVKPFAYLSRSPISDSITLAQANGFAVSDTILLITDTLTFIGLVDPPDADIISRQWSFGDSTNQSKGVVRHSYIQAGLFNAVFSVTDLSGHIYSDTVKVLVNPHPIIQPFAFLSNIPVPDSITLAYASHFATSDTIHTANDTLTFLGFIDPPGASIASKQWSLGDSTFASNSIIRHAYLRAGSYNAVFSITNPIGQTFSDTVKVIVNSPPGSIVLINPTGLTESGTHQPPVFSWLAADPDSFPALKYAIYIGKTLPLTSADLKGINLDTTWYVGWNPGPATGIYFWKVAVSDGFDTLVSTVDSFSIVNYSVMVGKCAGVIRLAGVQSHDGVEVTCVLSGGTANFSATTDENGYFFIPNMFPGYYRLTATEQQRSGYRSAGRDIQIVIRDSTWVDTLTLPDTSNPFFSITFPGEDDTLKTGRSITLTGTLADMGSGIRPDSTKIFLNGTVLADFIAIASNWNVNIPNLADGRYTLKMEARDSAGNPASGPTRHFYVNNKSISLSISADTLSVNDTLTFRAMISNALPSIRAYYFSAGSGNRGIWNDSILTTSDTVAFKWVAVKPTPSDTIRVMAVDDSGMPVYGLAEYHVVQDPPIIDRVPSDTILDYSGSIHCYVLAHQRFGILRVEFCHDSQGLTWIPVSNISGLTDTLFSTDYASSWPPVRIRVTDDDLNVVERQFNVGIRPGPVSLIGFDSTANTLTATFSKTRDSDFLEYRIYRSLTSAVDTHSTRWAVITNPAETTFTGPSENHAWVRYFYKIYVKDRSGLWNDGSNVLSARIMNTPPSMVKVTSFADNDTLLEGFAPATSLWQPLISWQAADTNRPYDTLSYKVFLDTLSPPLTLVYSGRDSSYRPATATFQGKRTHYLKIEAMDKAGQTISTALRFFLPEDPYNKMRSIPDGLFQMGSTSELPIHSVSLSSFKISNTCITQKEYERVMGINPSDNTSSPFLPVEQVNWFDAIRFCMRRTALEGRQQCYDTAGWTPTVTPYRGPGLDVSKNGYRLPTEAEWEYACRAGTTTDYYWGANPTNDYAWYFSNAGYSTHPVAMKLPNGFGLFDMNGNVWEWCWDWFGNYGVDPQKDPAGPGSGTYRTLRGGSWGSGINSLRSAFRNIDFPYSRYNDTGFRVVCR